MRPRASATHWKVIDKLFSSLITVYHLINSNLTWEKFATPEKNIWSSKKFFCCVCSKKLLKKGFLKGGDLCLKKHFIYQTKDNLFCKPHKRKGIKIFIFYHLITYQSNFTAFQSRNYLIKEVDCYGKFNPYYHIDQWYPTTG